MLTDYAERGPRAEPASAARHDRRCRPAWRRSPRRRRSPGRSTCRSGRTRSPRRACCSSRRRRAWSSTSPAPSRPRPAGTCWRGSGARPASRIEALRFLSVALAAALAGLTVVYAHRFLPLWAAGAAGVLTGARLAGGRARERAARLLPPRAPDPGLRAPARARGGGGAAPRAPGRARGVRGRRRVHALLLPARGVAGLVWLAVERDLRAGRGPRRRGRDRPRLGHPPRLAPRARRPGRRRALRLDRRLRRLEARYLPSALFWDPGTTYAERGSDPGRRRGCSCAWRFWRSSSRLRRPRPGWAPRPGLCALLVVVPIGASGIAWLAGLRIITGRNLIGVTAFAAVALAAVLLPAARRAAASPRPPAASPSRWSATCARRWPSGSTSTASRTRSSDVGWEPGDPILVVGSMADFRSPLEWYLPGDVTLPEADRRRLRRAVGGHRRARRPDARRRGRAETRAGWGRPRSRASRWSGTSRRRGRGRGGPLPRLGRRLAAYGGEEPLTRRFGGRRSTHTVVSSSPPHGAPSEASVSHVVRPRST